MVILNVIQFKESDLHDKTYLYDNWNIHNWIVRLQCPLIIMLLKQLTIFWLLDLKCFPRSYSLSLDRYTSLLKTFPRCITIFFSATGCGRSLGMTTGDIKDYQIETSSNYKDIHQSRAMQGIEGWCSSATDMNRWLMVS